MSKDGAHGHGYVRVTERLHKQPRTKEHPRTKNGARDRVLEWIDVGIATPCCGPSLPQTRRQSACSDGGWLGTRNSDSLIKCPCSAFLHRHTISAAYANAQDHRHGYKATVFAGIAGRVSVMQTNGDIGLLLTKAAIPRPGIGDNMLQRRLSGRLVQLYTWRFPKRHGVWCK
jgi:hypothetical protein